MLGRGPVLTTILAIITIPVLVSMKSRPGACADGGEGRVIPALRAAPVSMNARPRACADIIAESVVNSSEASQ